jgi:hypothetical protein
MGVELLGGFKEGKPAKVVTTSPDVPGRYPRAMLIGRHYSPLLCR